METKNATGRQVSQQERMNSNLRGKRDGEEGASSSSNLIRDSLVLREEKVVQECYLDS